ncbi:multidrug resistance efflux pump [Filimonas zeae]|uniref:Hemolysin D n=1 Tax=Filimonas zeae TaxID=1737353 RepID=A0A917IWV9_9BACT|nr:HlyD family efflux transporter periplasmic adaptor subunit [Filimonas zeae]MDR6339100.1 multidrug resistance efflux pump [Filimonas zeae]GGH65110.1 hemolysin D [Filimonas zeae]
MTEQPELKNVARTEEIQEIIDRMPNRFGFWISMVVLFIVILLAVFGFTIRYPDVVTGSITINAESAPVKLVANSSGNIYLNSFHSQSAVKKGDYIAIIRNAAQAADVQKIQLLAENFNLNAPNIRLEAFPRTVSLGELNAAYFSFLSAYEHFVSFYKHNLFTKQEEVLRQSITEQQNLLDLAHKKLENSTETMRLTNKFYKRDSTLFSEHILAEAEIDKTHMNKVSAKDAHESTLSNIINLREQLQQSINQLQQVSIQKEEKEREVKLELISTYTDLMGNIRQWEQKYVFKSPMNGKVEFLKFLTNDEFIQSGDAIFTIVPLQDKIIGQMILPSAGAGKVKTGQNVIVKLENYPFAEYGSITGKVSSISLTTNPVKTASGDIETYLVNITLPHQLTTNYGSQLDFKFQIKGTGEIITKDRKLAERLFDNLKYTLHR